MPGGPSPSPSRMFLPAVPAPEFRFATACGVVACAQCSLDSSKECERCEAGHFAFKYSYDVLSKAPLCLECAPLGCGPAGCLDQQVCG